MAKITKLPENPIGKDDRAKLESYGAHEIALGRATRFHWDETDDGSPVFEIFRGGENETLAVRIGRDREADEFWAGDSRGEAIVTGTLDHVMAVLDEGFSRGNDGGWSA